VRAPKPARPLTFFSPKPAGRGHPVSLRYPTILVILAGESLKIFHFWLKFKENTLMSAKIHYFNGNITDL
jgi:hypothetical protein